MTLIFGFFNGWYLPYCNFKLPLLIRFACVQILVTKLDAINCLEKYFTLIKALQKTEEITAMLKEDDFL